MYCARVYNIYGIIYVIPVIVDDTSQRRTYVYALAFTVTFWGIMRITCVTFT